MANLVLELKPGEMMVINGATIRFRSRTRIELLSRARFLFGKQIMAPEEANTPARRIYYALQTAYVGTSEERAKALQDLDRMVARFRIDAKSGPVHPLLDTVLQCALADDCYVALKLGRRIIRHEDTVMHAQSTGEG